MKCFHGLVKKRFSFFIEHSSEQRPQNCWRNISEHCLVESDTR